MSLGEVHGARALLTCDNEKRCGPRGRRGPSLGCKSFRPAEARLLVLYPEEGPRGPQGPDRVTYVTRLVILGGVQTSTRSTPLRLPPPSVASLSRWWSAAPPTWSSARRPFGPSSWTHETPPRALHDQWHRSNESSRLTWLVNFPISDMSTAQVVPFRWTRLPFPPISNVPRHTGSQDVQTAWA